MPRVVVAVDWADGGDGDGDGALVEVVDNVALSLESLLWEAGAAGVVVRLTSFA